MLTDFTAMRGSVSPATEIRLVATDIDGTIVPYGGLLSDRTRDSLHNCVNAGIDVIMITGRPPRWLPPVIEATGLKDIIICANGAVTVDPVTGEVLKVTRIEGDIAREAISRVQSAVPDAAFAAEHIHGLATTAQYEALRRARPQTAGLAPIGRSTDVVSSIPEMLQRGETFKITIRTGQLNPDSFLDLVQSEVGDLLSVTRSVVGEASVELGPTGVTKASGLAEIVEARGIDLSQVIAFGDMPNDMEMLASVGYGFAMSDGDPATLEAATHLAPNAAKDGVAQILEQLLLASDPMLTRT